MTLVVQLRGSSVGTRLVVTPVPQMTLVVPSDDFQKVPKSSASSNGQTRLAKPSVSSSQSIALAMTGVHQLLESTSI